MAFRESHESFQKMPYDEAYRAIGLDNVCAIYRKELLMNISFPEVAFAVQHFHSRSAEYRFNRTFSPEFFEHNIYYTMGDSDLF
jgi:hypothetical protein